MRTEEEAKYDLDERMSIQTITEELDTTEEYVSSVLMNVSTETS
jgi:hypothetical protein